MYDSLALFVRGRSGVEFNLISSISESFSPQGGRPGTGYPTGETLGSYLQYRSTLEIGFHYWQPNGLRTNPITISESVELSIELLMPP
jgi:hypothetical protein